MDEKDSLEKEDDIHTPFLNSVKNKIRSFHIKSIATRPETAL